MPEPLYLVRQYRPAYFSGYTDAVFKNVPRDKLTALPWFRNFEHGHDGGFDKFVVEPYPHYGPGASKAELIISAYYNNGKHWVAGFAIPETDPFAKDWRYAGAVDFSIILDSPGPNVL